MLSSPSHFNSNSEKSTNKNGDNGSPCQMPILALKSPNTLPIQKNNHCGRRNTLVYQINHSIEKPYCTKMHAINHPLIPKSAHEGSLAHIAICLNGLGVNRWSKTRFN